MPNRHAYVGDVVGGSGRKIGDIILATTSPGLDFSPLDGGQRLSADYPALLSKRSDLINVGSVGANGAAVSALGFFDGSAYYYLNSGSQIGYVYKLTSPSAAATLVKDFGTTYSQSNGWFIGNGGYWRTSNGLHFRNLQQYLSGGATNEYYFLSATDPTGSWVQSSSHWTSPGIADVDYVGSNYVCIAYNASAGKNYLYYSADRHTWSIISSTSAYAWNKLFYADGTLYAVSNAGPVAHSTDGVNWTVAAAPANAPTSASIFYHALSGRWFGLDGSTVVSSGSLTSDWTIERTATITNGLVDGGGVVFHATDSGLYWSKGDGAWQQSDTSAFPTNAGYASFGFSWAGYACVVPGQSGLLRTSNLTDRFEVLNMNTVRGLSPYMKVK